MPIRRAKDILKSPQIAKQFEALDEGGYARSANGASRKPKKVTSSGLGDVRLQTIFLDDPSFNFDYAHILPKTEKCSVMHGHTSSALVEIMGWPVDGMIVDFNDAKPIIRRAIADLDHKLFIREKYVTGRTGTHVDLSFSTVHGEFSLHVPKQTTVLLEGEATVENLAQELASEDCPQDARERRGRGRLRLRGPEQGDTPSGAAPWKRSWDETEAIVLLSGGIDSATCLCLARRDGHSVRALTIEIHGTAEAELRAARRLGKRVGVVEHRFVRVPDLREAKDIEGSKELSGRGVPGPTSR